MDKRTFLKALPTLGLAATPFFRNLEKITSEVGDQSPRQLAENEDFWEKIRADYKLKPDYINLENGYYCFLPQDTLNAFLEHVKEVNYQGSYYMRTVQWDNKKAVATKLAQMADCEPDELVITRNTTESLDTIIGGFPWKSGDEAVMSNQDYGAMLNMFKLVEKRHGVVRKLIDVPMDPKTDEEVVAAYAAAITPKTRLLMVCHMVNITGHILPSERSATWPMPVVWRSW